LFLWLAPKHHFFYSPSWNFEVSVSALGSSEKGVFGFGFLVFGLPTNWTRVIDQRLKPKDPTPKTKLVFQDPLLRYIDPSGELTPPLRSRVTANTAEFIASAGTWSSIIPEPLLSVENVLPGIGLF